MKYVLIREDFIPTNENKDKFFDNKCIELTDNDLHKIWTGVSSLREKIDSIRGK